jgi:glycosyltransferase involved in cell wall biosynthesis
MSEKSVLIFAYYSYKDPIFQSAVLPYFTLDNNKEKGVKYVLMTFEKKELDIVDRAELENTKLELFQKYNIQWHKLTWRSGSFKIIKKLIDFIEAFWVAYRLVKKNNVKAVYSEGFPGAIMGHHISKLAGIKHMVHTFEPHNQYMIEAGVWASNSWEAKLLNYYEKKIARRCSHIFTATELMMERLKSWGSDARMIRTPSCVDTSIFKFSDEQRVAYRKQLGLSDDVCLITYMGKFGGMYMQEELFEFFEICNQRQEQKFHFLILTVEDHQKVKQWFGEVNISEQKFTIYKATREEIPAYLSASDYGFVAVRQQAGKRFCSPIKDGEYWACGLPVIIPKEVSDDFIFTEQYQLGIVLEDFSKEEFNQKIDVLIKQFNAENKDALRARCRDFVLKDRDAEQFRQLYQEIFQSI